MFNLVSNKKEISSLIGLLLTDYQAHNFSAKICGLGGRCYKDNPDLLLACLKMSSLKRFPNGKFSCKTLRLLGDLFCMFERVKFYIFISYYLFFDRVGITLSNHFNGGDHI